MSRRMRCAVWTTVTLTSGLWLGVHAAPKSAPLAAAVRAFLQKHIGWGASADHNLRYSFAEVSLNGKSPRQVFVYLAGTGWCGTGGCTAFLLKPKGTSFTVIDRFTLARLPIRMLPSITNGWHDIAMPVQGGGIINEHMAILRFNGSAYPSNPSMAPKLAQKLAGLGMEIPLSTQGASVY